MPMQVENLARDAEQFTSNAFLVDQVALVDVGAAPVVVDRIGDRNLEQVVITHTHRDHIANLEQVVELYHPEVYAYNPDNVSVDAEQLGEGDEIELSGVTFDVMHTPGHRDDHIVLYSPTEQVLFAGDLLFPGGSFGRTDLEQGDRDELIMSIRRVAGHDIQVMYCGHDAPATQRVNEQIARSLENAEEREPKYD